MRRKIVPSSESELTSSVSRFSPLFRAAGARLKTSPAGISYRLPDWTSLVASRLGKWRKVTDAVFLNTTRYFSIALAPEYGLKVREEAAPGHLLCLSCLPYPHM